MAEHHIDAMGEMCPLPILRSDKVYNKLNKGDILVVTTDHSCSLKAFPLHFVRYRSKTEIKEVARGIWQIYIYKT